MEPDSASEKVGNLDEQLAAIERNGLLEPEACSTPAGHGSADEPTLAPQGLPLGVHLMPFAGQVGRPAEGIGCVIALKDGPSGLVAATDGKAFRDAVAEFAKRYKVWYGREVDLVEAVLSVRRALAYDDLQRQRSDRGSSRRKLTVSEANDCLIDVFRVDPEHARSLTCRQWAAKLECSPTTIHRTAAWQFLAKRKSRGRAGGRKPRRAVALTDLVANDRVEETLEELIQEQARDARRYRHRKTI